MAARGYIKGNEAFFDEGIKRWRWSSNRKIVEEGEMTKCPLCKKCSKINEPDPCLGHLPGVYSACCGHGVEDSYILFDNMVRIRGFRISE